MKKLLIVMFCLAFAAPSFALTGVSFGVKGGLLTNYDQPSLSTPSEDNSNMALGGLQVRFSSIPMFDVIVSGEYAWRSDSYSILGETVDFKTRDLLFSASAVYPFELPFATPYFGAGLATHNVGFDVDYPATWALADEAESISTTETRMGYHLMTGFEIGLPAFPLKLNAEYRLNWIDMPYETAKVNTFTAGLVFSLP